MTLIFIGEEHVMGVSGSVFMLDPPMPYKDWEAGMQYAVLVHTEDDEHFLPCLKNGDPKDLDRVEDLLAAAGYEVPA